MTALIDRLETAKDGDQIHAAMRVASKLAPSPRHQALVLRWLQEEPGPAAVERDVLYWINRGLNDGCFDAAALYDVVLGEFTQRAQTTMTTYGALHCEVSKLSSQLILIVDPCRISCNCLRPPITNHGIGSMPSD